MCPEFIQSMMGYIKSEIKLFISFSLFWIRLNFQLHPTEPASILSRIQKLYSYIRRYYSKKKLRAGKIDRSLLQGESFELFSAAIRSPATRDPYERKLLGFLKRVNLSPDRFVQFAKENPSAAEKKIISLISQDRLKKEAKLGKIASSDDAYNSYS